MLITATPYNGFLLDLGAGVHNFAADTDKVALLAAAYTPNFSTHVSYADVSANEVTGTGYTAGGITLSGVTWTVTGNVATLGANTATWAALSTSARYAVVYRSGGTNRLIGLLDFGEVRSYVAEPLQLAFPSGVLTITGSVTTG